jgi:hypothetical protein
MAGKNLLSSQKARPIGQQESWVNLTYISPQHTVPLCGKDDCTGKVGLNPAGIADHLTDVIKRFYPMGKVLSRVSVSEQDLISRIVEKA